MPIEIVRNDITKMEVDAIVNAAKNSLLGGGGVDGAIHAAAGPELKSECETLGGCKTGDAKITGAYRLPCKYVIHTVGPVYHDGKHGERQLLISCYRRSLELAKEKQCETVAFPLISAGAFGYPKAEALHVAMSTVSEFLLENDMTVYIVVFGSRATELGSKLAPGLREFIDDNYVREHRDTRNLFSARYAQAHAPQVMQDEMAEMVGRFSKAERDDWSLQLDESFSQAVLRLIDERGMTDPEVYRRANISRQAFSKLRNKDAYQPKKTTALALAVALKLSLPETKELLEKAGYAISHSNLGDVIVEYFILHGKYDINEINIALFDEDQLTLGS